MTEIDTVEHSKGKWSIVAELTVSVDLLDMPISPKLVRIVDATKALTKELFCAVVHWALDLVKITSSSTYGAKRAEALLYPRMVTCYICCVEIKLLWESEACKATRCYTMP